MRSMVGAVRCFCEGARVGSWMRVEGVRVGVGFVVVGGLLMEALSLRFSSMLGGTSREAVGSRTVVGRTDSLSSCGFFLLKKDIMDG